MTVVVYVYIPTHTSARIADAYLLYAFSAAESFGIGKSHKINLLF